MFTCKIHAHSYHGHSVLLHVLSLLNNISDALLLCNGTNVRLSQEVPDELVAMAERFEAWRERKDSQRDGRGRPGGGRGGRGRGGRRDRNMSSFI